MWCERWVCDLVWVAWMWGERCVCDVVWVAWMWGERCVCDVVWVAWMWCVCVCGMGSLDVVCALCVCVWYG